MFSHVCVRVHTPEPAMQRVGRGVPHPVLLWGTPSSPDGDPHSVRMGGGAIQVQIEGWVLGPPVWDPPPPNKQLDGGTPHLRLDGVRTPLGKDMGKVEVEVLLNGDGVFPPPPPLTDKLL